MMDARTFGAAVYCGLKSAQAEAVGIFGSQTMAAKFTRIDQQSFSKALSRNDEHADRFFAGDVILDLDKAAGRPVIVEYMAEVLGFMLVPVPPAILDGSDLGLALGQLGKEVGEVFHDLSVSFSDGRITAAEHAANAKTIAEAHRALAVLAALNDARAKESLDDE